MGLEAEKARLEDRLDVVTGSLEEKMATGRDYDRVIQEAEQAYTKILESSQVLLNVVQTRSQDLRTNPTREERMQDLRTNPTREERRGSGGKPAHFITSTTPDSGFHQAK